jgi:hypothetical protein
MEIEQLRKELNELLEKVVEHSNNYLGKKQIPSLEISFLLAKINKMQEHLIILKHLLSEQELEIIRQEKLVAEGRAKQMPAIEIEHPIVNLKENEQEPILPKENIVATQTIEQPEIKTEEVATPEKPKAKKDIEKLPIAKLVDAFSLNDRYLYANELFNKNMSAFTELIKSIDNCTSYQEAEQLLTNTKNELDWDTDYIHVLSFYSLVERRFL